jgi:hypothetical protein
MNFLRLLLLLLITSIILQNTCPYGYAAKTAFTAPHTHDCPLKKSRPGHAKDRNSVDDKPGKSMYSSFVFSVPESHAVISRFQTKSEYAALSPGNYNGPFREPPERPPAA